MALILSAVPALAESTVDLSDEERRWVAAHRDSIVLGAEPNYRPYCYVDATGKLGGMTGDTMRLLEERLGLRFKVKRYEKFSELLKAVEAREIDVVPFLTVAEEREGYLSFTSSFYTTSDRLIVRLETTGSLSLENVQGRVGIVEGYALEAKLRKERPDLNLVPVASELVGLQMLSFGDLDALICDVGVASHNIAQEKITNLRVAGEVIRDDDQTLGVRNDWPLLVSILNKGLASIEQDERDAIERRWVHLGGVDPLELDRFWRTAAWALIGALIVVGLGVAWNWSLRRLVAQRTRELERELSERLKAEAKAARLAVAVERAAEHVVLLDSSGRIEYANPAFEEASGLSGLTNLELSALVVPADMGQLEEAFPAVAAGGAWRGRLRFQREGASPLHVTATLAPIPLGVESAGGYVMVCRDITHEEELEAQLRHREKLSALGTFASGMAHDFNNLLVPILNYSSLLRRETSEEGQEYLSAIVQSGQRAAELVRRILLFSRPSEGARKATDLRLVVEEAVALVRSVAPATVQIDVDLEARVLVLAVVGQVQQIVMNLCSNALHAMEDEGGRLRVSLKTCSSSDLPSSMDLLPGSYAALSVVDTGIGMSPEVQARIFEPYFSSKPSTKGTGLGLASVHGIVVSHGGDIHVTSQAGQGTTFQVVLPLIEEEAPEAESVGNPPPGKGERLLVVDDDEVVLQAQSQLLEALSYRVEACSSPLRALELFRADPSGFDAILSDCTMAELNGLKLLDEIHALRPDIPAILISGILPEVAPESVLVLQKPLGSALLASSLQAALTREPSPPG